MTRDIVKVVTPLRDKESQSYAHKVVTPATISTANGATLEGAAAVKNDSLVIVVNATTAGTVTFKAGDYDNAVLGDLAVACSTGVNAILIENMSRFQTKGGNIDVDFTTIAGTIYAVGRYTGLEPVEE